MSGVLNNTMNRLKALGFSRDKTDFDPTKNPRPLYEMFNTDAGGQTLKAVVGPLWTTVWSVRTQGTIDEIDSAKTEVPDAVERLVKRLLD